MNVVEKIKRSWWVILSFIMFINGLGFIYLGFKNNNKYWVLEGVMYEIPWLFTFIFVNDLLVFSFLVYFALILMLVSIVRSIWVAVKLSDVYDNEEKYTVRPTVIKNHNKPKENSNFISNLGCCFCIIVMFFLFALIAIL